MIKIYIAGSITHNANYLEDFLDAEKYLKEKGYEPINPAKKEGKDYKWYIDEGLKQLMDCEAIYLLKNWQQSKGACLEKRYAQVVGIPIFKQSNGELPSSSISERLKNE